MKVEKTPDGSKKITFKIMRLIQPFPVVVEGIGRIWIYYDIKYDRSWAKRMET